MQSPVTPKQQPRVFYGWWIVLSAGLINLYGAGVWFYGFPIFFKALVDDFGWGRGVAAGAISFSRLEGGLEAPIVGWLVDKFGPRKLAIAGAVIAGLGFLAMSAVNDVAFGSVQISALVMFYIVYGGVISIGYNTGFSHATMAAIANWFSRKRSRAFAIVSLGSGGSGLTVLALGMLVAKFGWRVSAALVGVGMWIWVIPLSFILRHKPQPYGYMPDGDSEVYVDGPPDAEKATQPSIQRERHTEYNFTPKEAMLTSAFWLLVLGSMARSITMSSVVIHEVAYLTDIGISDIAASGALGAMVTISLVGRLSFGWVGDYFDKRYVIIVSFVVQALGIFLLSRIDSLADMWLFVVVYGIGYGGAIPIYWAIVGDYFGGQYYATIRGFQQLAGIPAAIFGPIYAGLVYDFSGSYQIAFASFVVTLLVGTVFVLFMRPPRIPERLATPTA